ADLDQRTGIRWLERDGLSKVLERTFSVASLPLNPAQLPIQDGAVGRVCERGRVQLNRIVQTATAGCLTCAAQTLLLAAEPQDLHSAGQVPHPGTGGAGSFKPRQRTLLAV